MINNNFNTEAHQIFIRLRGFSIDVKTLIGVAILQSVVEL